MKGIASWSRLPLIRVHVNTNESFLSLSVCLFFFFFGSSGNSHLRSGSVFPAYLLHYLVCLGRRPRFYIVF